MYTQKIVLAGGPGTGKTSTLKALKKGKHYCLEEISRQITLKAQNEGIDQLFLEDPLLFSRQLLQGRIQQFQKADNSSVDICFFDRGIPDVAAYMEYKNETVPKAFRRADQEHRYDHVFFFPLWEEIYTSDNERYESFEEAQKIQGFIKNAYQNLGYNLIEVPKGPIKARVAFILNTIKHGTR